MKPEINKDNLEWLLKQSIETKLSMLENHLDIVRLVINDLLEQEVVEFCGERYSHIKPHDGRYSRWGNNTAMIRIGEHRLRVDVPRVYDNERQCNVSLKSHERLREITVDEEYLLRAVMLGLSVRDFADLHEGNSASSQGMSKTAVDEAFIASSKESLRVFEERRFDNEQYTAIFVDGKHLSGQQIILALGVSADGQKHALGFCQSSSENSLPIGEMFSGLINRGLNIDQGILFIVDGAKGLRKAISDVFGACAVVQRCQWHKRENVIAHLTKLQQPMYKRRLSDAYANKSLSEAQEELHEIGKELYEINRSASQSLDEGMEETLTLHRLEMTAFRISFSTTNCIENLNSQLAKTTRNVKRWSNSDQYHRWVATGVIEAERRMHRVNNYLNLHLLQEALTKHITQPNFN